MKVLIIASPIRAASAGFHIHELLGIEYLAAYTRHAGHEVQVLDASLAPAVPDGDGSFHVGVPMEQVSQLIRDSRPDVVGVSCHYEFSAPYAYDIVRRAKEIDPEIVTVMGGLFVSVNTTKPINDCPELDYALVGEGETAFVNLLSAIGTGQVQSIDGIIFRTDAGKVRYNPKKNYIEDLDSVPFPARDLVDIETYMRGGFDYQLYGLGYRPSLSLLTSRSCPMGCTFCNMKLVHGRRWRHRSADNCVEELKEMVGRWGAQHVHIMDDFFTLRIDRAKEFCRQVINSGIKVRWNTPNGISVKKIDKELCDLMKRAGCANVCVAIESGSEKVRIEIMNKKTRDEEIVSATARFREAGIPVVGFVIIGMPGETVEENRKSIDFIKKLPLTSIVTSFVVPFRGTQLYDELRAAGKLDDRPFGRDDYKNPVSMNEGISVEQMVGWKEELRGHFGRLSVLRELEMQAERAVF